MMRNVMLVALLFVGSPSLVHAQVFGGGPFDLDTIPIERIAEEWRTYGESFPGIRYVVEGILFDAEDPRADSLFNALLPVLREGALGVHSRTGSLLGRADARVPGKWTGVLIQEARFLLEQELDVTAVNLIGRGSIGLQQGGRGFLSQRVRSASDTFPMSRYSAQILIPTLASLPGGREALRGMLNRGELRGWFVAWAQMHIGG